MQRDCVVNAWNERLVAPEPASCSFRCFSIYPKLLACLTSRPCFFFCSSIVCSGHGNGKTPCPLPAARRPRPGGDASLGQPGWHVGKLADVPPIVAHLRPSPGRPDAGHHNLPMRDFHTESLSHDPIHGYIAFTSPCGRARRRGLRAADDRPSLAAAAAADPPVADRLVGLSLGRAHAVPARAGGHAPGQPRDGRRSTTACKRSAPTCPAAATSSR